ncbi:MAG: DUF2853 family protein [Methylophilaceae bacterium]
MADTNEYKAALAKYTSNINDGALEQMAKTYALVMSNKDAKNVACGDPAEKETVRDNFLKKKLGLTNSDNDLDAGVEAVCATMKEDRMKNRLVFYYLLAEKYNKLGVFA